MSMIPLLEEDPETLNVFTIQTSRCKMNMMCLLFLFVFAFVVLVALVTWSISNTIHNNTESELVQQLTRDALQNSLRRLGTNIIIDAYNVTQRGLTVAQFAQINDSTVHRDSDLKDVVPYFLGEIATHPRLSAMVFGCSTFFVSVQKLFDMNGTPENLILLSTAALANGTWLWNGTVTTFNASTLNQLSSQYESTTSEYPQTYFTQVSEVPTWDPISFLQQESIAQYPVLSTTLVQRVPTPPNAKNSSCGVVNQFVLADAIVTAWLSESQDNYPDAILFVVETATRLLLFDSTPHPTIYLKSNVSGVTVYACRSIDDSLNPVLSEAVKYINLGSVSDTQYNGILGATYIATAPLVDNGFNWTVVVVIPSSKFFPNLTVSLITFGVTVAIVVFSAICSLLVAKIVSVPVTQLTKKMRDLAEAKWDRQKPLRFQFMTEFSRIQRSFSDMEMSLKMHSMKLNMLVQHRTSELQKALEEADRANRFKSNFLANMSHEAKLHGVISLINFLLDSKLDEEQREWCKDIKSSTLALTQVLNDILDLSKVEAGKMLIECTEFDLLSCLEEVINLFYRVIMETKDKDQLDLLIQYHPNLPRVVYGDPTRVRQIVTNLLSNAVKFTRKGIILLKVDSYSGLPARDYQIPGSQEFGDLKVFGLNFEVTDTGIGMSKDQADAMFTEYTQADLSIARKYGGTGLGLAITKNLVHLLGGNISVRSEVEKGSTFHFYIFLGRKILPERVSELTNNLSGKGLIISPNEECFRTISEYLSGIFTWTFTNELQEANSLIKSSDFGVVLVDSPFLLQIDKKQFDSIYDSEIRDRTRFILLKDGRITLSSVPDLFHGILGKPLRPSSLLFNWTEMMSPKRIKEKKQEKKVVYKELYLNIMLVEDNLVNQKVASLLLKKMKCSVTVCSNGVDAVQKFQSCYQKGGARPPLDVILMDVMMPIMDGITATQEIRKWESENGNGNRIPIIALTAHAMVDDKEKCLKAGMDHYLSKPLDPEQLSSLLLKLTKK